MQKLWKRKVKIAIIVQKRLRKIQIYRKRKSKRQRIMKMRIRESISHLCCWWGVEIRNREMMMIRIRMRMIRICWRRLGKILRLKEVIKIRTKKKNRMTMLYELLFLKSIFSIIKINRYIQLVSYFHFIFWLLIY